VCSSDLKAWRHERAQKEDVVPFQIMHLKTLIQIAVHLPADLQALENIKGIGPRLAERYGEDVVELVSSYRHKHRIETITIPESDKESAYLQQSSKGETMQITLELTLQGLAIEEIAEKRNLARSTVESHLVRLLQCGKLELSRVLADDKRELIEKTIEEKNTKSLKELKEALGDEVSYNEIKMVQAWSQRQESP
jgi:uncharacterized protein YpbB